jgi:hypothetical protein
MVPSSTLCRAQESLHRRRAADTLLENVRIVATNAAVAWGHEADAAERRERRQEKGLILAEAAARKTELDLLSSENPDRARACGQDVTGEDRLGCVPV